MRSIDKLISSNSNKIEGEHSIVYTEPGLCQIFCYSVCIANINKNTLCFKVFYYGGPVGETTIKATNAIVRKLIKLGYTHIQ